MAVAQLGERSSAGERWRAWARRLKREVYTLALAYRDPRVLWYARVVIVCVVAYALSPIDLIPDAIPVLGYLDDLIPRPLGVALAIRLLPPNVLAEHRATAERRLDEGQGFGRIAATIIVALRLALAGFGALLAWRWWRWATASASFLKYGANRRPHMYYRRSLIA